MNLIFIRHGKATDNTKEIISDKEIYWSILTKEGEKCVKDTIKILPTIINKMYVSPFPRTIQTASLVYKKHLEAEVIIENRLREINSGKYSGQKNNNDLDQVRIKQIEGDYFIRLGDYGENRYDIEYRLTQFLNDIYKNNNSEDTILIVSHGSIISYMKRILNIKTKHIKTGKAEIFNDVNFIPAIEHLKNLKTIYKQKPNTN